MENKKYSVIDTIYAWLSLVFAFFLCQIAPVERYPLGGFLLIFALFITGFVVLGIKKVKIKPICIISAVSALVIGSALLLTNAWFLIKLSLAYSLASYCYFLYAAFGNRIEEGFSDYIYIDFIKILFVLPFRSLGAIFPALGSKSQNKGSMWLVKILLGIGIAIVPTVMVLLFLSYDNDFVNLLDNIFTLDEEKVLRILRSLFYSLPLAMFGFGLYASSRDKHLHSQMTAQACSSGLQKTKILPQLTALVAVLPVLFLYVVFFISQWKYYVSGFTGVLPEDFSYAEYARQGFFELCAVSVLNLILIVGIAFFIKRGKKGSPVILKIVAAVFCLCTLILISTAVAKLVMYIETYGLTQKRIYAMWLMALIGIVFLVIAAGQFLPKMKVVAVCVSIAIVMFAGLSVCNVNALCAKYNVDRYLSGSLSTIDVSNMEELGDSAIPSLVRLATDEDGIKDAVLNDHINHLLDNRVSRMKEEEFSVFSFSIPSLLAKAALKDYK